MSGRKALSKARRFAIFHRDGFTCQYCGKRPPAVVLEVDHIVPVSQEGSDDDHNLITSCFDCNRGKGAGVVEVGQIDVSERAAALVERLEQAKAYEALLAQERETLELATDAVAHVYEKAFPEWTLTDTARGSIRDFLRKLPRGEVVDAMDMACARTSSGRAFKYFCGVCWRKIKGDR